jgi:hypothetical protein
MPPTNHQQQATTPPPAWRTSSAKVHLKELLLDDSSWIQLCTTKEIWNDEPLFKQYKWENFRNNFNSMKTSIEQEQSCVKFDEAAFEKEKAMFPRNVTTERGYLFWNGHAADK